MTTLIFPSKIVGETTAYVFDFSDRLQFGETINGASVALAVTSGEDPSPGDMVSGTATYTDSVVTQNITGGVAGVLYTMVCTVTATNSHNYIKQGSLAVINASGNFLAAN